MVCRLEDLSIVIREVGRQVYHAVQQLETVDKLPVSRGPEFIEFTATVLVSPDALNAIERVQASERTGEAVEETVMPEIRSTVASQRAEVAKVSGSNTETGKESTTSESEENGTENALDNGTETSENTDTSESNEVQIHATADDVTVSA